MRRLETLLLLVLLFLPAEAAAQRWDGFYDRKTLVFWHGEMPPGIEENFREVLWPKLTPDERRRLGGVDLAFPLENAQHPMNFYASPPGTKKTIILPISSLRFLADIALAYAWLNTSGYSIEPVTDYLAMLKYQWPGGLAGRRYRPRDVLGIPDDAISNPRVARQFQQIFGTAVVFVLGHELGHHYYQHRTDVTPEVSRRDEEDADRFAMELMRRIGDAPVGAVAFFNILAHLAPYASDPNYLAMRKDANSSRVILTPARHRRRHHIPCRGFLPHRNVANDAGHDRRPGARSHQEFRRAGRAGGDPPERAQRQARAARTPQAGRGHRCRSAGSGPDRSGVLRQLPRQMAEYQRHRLRRGREA